MEELTKELKKDGRRVIEVTQKIYYVLEKYEQRPLEEIKKEWFEDFKDRCHAYKDASKLGNKTDIIKVKEL